ncbi:MAG: hypothetical protein LKI37_06525 [Citrobacter freundii]|jgi:hypothetical protein|nr:hypothetical protein [Citrobacter freundii]MCI1825515.1 hypothetical protein [Citrobacter freundii]
MSENNYGALILKSPIAANVALGTINSPGIYPIVAGNGTAPDAKAGVMIVTPNGASGMSRDFKSSDGVLYSFINSAWARQLLVVDVGQIPYFTSIELTSSTPFIDFHYGSDSGDYTDRLLAMDDGLHYLASAGRMLTVNAPVAVEKDITVSGIIESRASRVTGVQSADKPGMTTDWNPVSGLTVFTNNRGPGAGGFAFRTIDATNKSEIGRVSFTELGDINAGNAKYAKDGNVYGTTWGVNGGSDWLSNFLASKFSGIQTQFNAIPVNNVTGDITGTAWGGLLSAHLAAKWIGIQAQFSAIPVDNGSGNIRGNQWGINGASDWLSNYINRRFSAIANQLVLSGGQNGYFKDVTTGFLVQFGRLESTTSGPETSGYNIAFPVQCLGVVASVGTEINSGVTVYTAPTNNQGFTYKTSAARTGFTWFAWGK